MLIIISMSISSPSSPRSAGLVRTRAGSPLSRIESTPEHGQLQSRRCPSGLQDLLGGVPESSFPVTRTSPLAPAPGLWRLLFSPFLGVCFRFHR